MDSVRPMSSMTGDLVQRGPRRIGRLEVGPIGFGCWRLTTASTAEAARMARGSRFRGAIASLEAAREQQLPVLAYPINDIAGNCTRFLLLGRGARAEGGPVASLAFSLQANRPGALLEALACFARLGDAGVGEVDIRPSGEAVFLVPHGLAVA